MFKSRSAIIGLLAITFFLNTSAGVLASAETPIPQANSSPAVTLQAASGAAIEFRTQNGGTVGDVPPQTVDLPHLVLYRDGALTDPHERTLTVELTGIEVPPAGVTVTVEVETQHLDPDLEEGASNRIPVWRESMQITNTSGCTETGSTAVFAHEFTAEAKSGRETIATPTDYFRYDIIVTDSNHSRSNPLYAFGGDYAFLMENQWTARLPEVQEESDGAAPDQLILYYCDMFAFRSKEQRLDRGEVPGYVHTELAPAMVKAFETQTNGWGMGPWYDEWAGFRGEKQLSVALAMPGTWFHGRAFNHSGISLLTYDDNAMGFEYDQLVDEHMSNFHHELFHNLQLNISRHAASDNFQNWKFFTEGQAVMAVSVAEPELEFDNKANYTSRANQFLRTGLNKSYAQVDPYQASIYWRFLYEQCGGIDADGVEHPEIGMQIVKRSLEQLYAQERTEDSIVEEMPGVMDRALEGSSCPFQTYAESLIGFARANYALRLEHERSTTAGPVGSSAVQYAQENVYTAPRLEAELEYDGAVLGYSGAIAASYGTDFVEISLTPELKDQPLTIRCEGDGTTARFHVQIWSLGTREGEAQTFTPNPEIISYDVYGNDDPGHLIPHLDTTLYDKLALIITRLDPGEMADAQGDYHITLVPSG